MPVCKVRYLTIPFQGYGKVVFGPASLFASASVEREGSDQGKYNPDTYSNIYLLMWCKYRANNLAKGEHPTYPTDACPVIERQTYPIV